MGRSFPRYRGRFLLVWLLAHAVTAQASMIANFGEDASDRYLAVTVIPFSAITGFVFFQFLLFGPRMLALLGPLPSPGDAERRDGLLVRLNQGAERYRHLWDVVGKIIVPIAVALIAAVAALLAAR